MSGSQTKKYLEGYRANMAKVQRLKREMQLYSLSAPIIEKEIEECIKKSNDIEEIIITHNNSCAREIMLRKYIYGQTLEKIAEELNYSSRHIQRILNTAVETLGANLN